MTHKKRTTKLIAGVLSVVMVFGVLMFVSPTEAQAISLNATDAGFYNLAYGANGDTTFGAGAQIRVINKTRADEGKSKSDAIYGYDGMTWSAVDTNNYIVWDGTDENTFYGVYPYNAEYNNFTLPTDQSGGVQDADWMTADYTAAKDEGNVNLNFHHLLAKVTVNITKWNSEFDGSEKVIEDPKIYTKGTAVEVTYATDGPNVTTSDGALTPITPSADGHTYTAIVAPAAYASTDKFMTFTVDGQAMTVLATTPKQTNGLNAGLHYTFNLTVGKDGVAIQSVNVNPWIQMDIVAGVAKEVVRLNVVDAIAMSADQLNAAVTKALEAGETDIEVTLKPDAPAEMITAIRRAICDTEGVADGSINLTLKGVTSIPGTTNWDAVAFGPRNAQWDENNVEIVSHEEVTQLASVNLPDVTEIGAQAFLDCSNLTSITAPKVQSIGDWGLQGTAITSIDMPLLKEARYSAFCRTALTEVSLPSLETAGVIVFGHCKQLRTVDLPKLQNLSQQLFTRCTSLVAVNAPAATSMGNNVFKGCSELVSITLQGVTELTYEAFAECTKLENITLGSVITNVNVNLFAGEALSSNITLTLHPDQANAEGDLKATAGTNVTWAGFTWKEVKFSATE